MGTSWDGREEGWEAVGVGGVGMGGSRGRGK